MSEGPASWLRDAFEQLRLHRLEAQIRPANHASVRLVQQLGFRNEGYSPYLLFIDGACEITLTMAHHISMLGSSPADPSSTCPNAETAVNGGVRDPGRGLLHDSEFSGAGPRPGLGPARPGLDPGRRECWPWISSGYGPGGPVVEQAVSRRHTRAVVSVITLIAGMGASRAGEVRGVGRRRRFPNPRTWWPGLGPAQPRLVSSGMVCVLDCGYHETPRQGHRSAGHEAR